jgi:hypothetical protein
MTLVSDIINRAFRESGITPVGGTPDANEAAEALPILVSLLANHYHGEAGENFVLREVTSKGVIYEDGSISNQVKSNSELVFKLTSPLTLYLERTPDDGALLSVVDQSANFATCPVTLNAGATRIEGSSTFLCNTNNFARTWRYDASQTQWLRVTDPIASDPFPFTASEEEYFVCLLAERLNFRYGVETPDSTLRTIAEGKRKMRARHKQTQEQPVEWGLISLPSNRGIASDFSTGS